MVRVRKATAPQRLSETRRNEETWNMFDNSNPVLVAGSSVPDVIDITEDNESIVDVSDRESDCVIVYEETPIWERINKRSKKRKGGDSIFEILSEDSEFYLDLHEPKEKSHSGAIELGSLCITLKEKLGLLTKVFPCRLYVSLLQGYSFICSVSNDVPSYVVVEDNLDFELFSGLQSHCFVLQVGHWDETSTFLTISIFLRADLCIETKRAQEINWRNAVITYFFGIAQPVYDEVYHRKAFDCECFFKDVKKFHSHEEYFTDRDVQHESLIPKLRKYQEQAVRWMLSREQFLQDKQEKLHCFYTEINLPNGQLMYYDKYFGSAVFEKPIAQPFPTGGILADEMGLGKTVEVLCCILNNPRGEQALEKKQCDPSVLDNTFASRQLIKEEVVPSNAADVVTNDLESEEITNSCSFKNRILFKNEFNKIGLTCENEESYTDLSDKFDQNPVYVNVSVESFTGKEMIISLENENILKNSIEDDKNILCNLPDSALINEVVVHDSFCSNSPLNAEFNCDSDVTERQSSQNQCLKRDINFEKNEDVTCNKKDSPEETNLEKHADSSKTRKKGIDKKTKKKRKRKKHVSIESEDSDSDWLNVVEIVQNEEKLSQSKNKSKQKKSKNKKAENQQKVSNGKVKKAKSKPPLVKSSRYESLKLIYDQMLAEMDPKKQKKRKPIDPLNQFTCICGDDSANQPKIRCENCSTLQHKLCMGAMPGKQYFCPHCWKNKEKLVSSATLIVTPTSIYAQWLSEMEKHVEKDKLKIMEYNGVGKQYIQPWTLAEYDIVLTTYEAMNRELVYAELQDVDSTRFRNCKRFLAPPSPLPCIKWWRLCIDEAQMIESPTSKTAEMALKLDVVHRWAITGTPIQKSLNDLYGLIVFLDVDPYCKRNVWHNLIYKPYCSGDNQPLNQLLSPILWRTVKKDVLDQIGIPPQSEEVHWLHFSAVEEHFYKLQQIKCSHEFSIGLTNFENLDIKIKSVERRLLTKILSPLLSLRQACNHHQIVKGFVVSQRDTMTMEELLEILIKKTKIQCEEALRQYVSAVNGMAGLDIIKEMWNDAVEKYRDVLRLVEEHKGTLTVDTPQVIHTLYNLSEVLQAHGETIPPTLRDGSLLDEAKSLEESYIQKRRNQFTRGVSIEDNFKKERETAASLGDSMQIGHPHWFVALLEWIVAEGAGDDLMTRITTTMNNALKESFRCRTVKSLTLQLTHWDDDLHEQRDKALKYLEGLLKTPVQDLVNAAVDCHLREATSKKKKCRLCLCESLLETYENLLFTVIKSKKQNTAIGDVVLLRSAAETSWMSSPYERVLKCVISACRTSRFKSRQLDKLILEDGNSYMKMLEAYKGEFKYGRMMWTALCDEVAVLDELYMAKMRLRIRYEDEPIPNKQKKPLQNLSSNTVNKLSTIHIIEGYEIESHKLRFQSEKNSAEGELRRKLGQLQYLKKLSTDPEPCPVCRSELSGEWSVLQCGHSFCMDCMQMMMKTETFCPIKCPICREVTRSNEISFVDLKKKYSNPIYADIDIKGSHSTKVEAAIRVVMSINKQEPDAKILIFSAWEKVLDMLHEALAVNDVNSRRLKTGKKYHKHLSEFKETSVNVLLLGLNLGAKGLNLTEASHIIFLEPILNPADELQAVGRIHRIGQKKETKVHRLLVHGTIEERMHLAINSSSEDWNGNKVTIRHLASLFGSDEIENSEREKAIGSDTSQQDAAGPSYQTR